MSTRVTQFMRRQRSGSFSIERLYEDVRAAMPHDCQVSVWTCRNFSNGLWPRLQDMWSARKAQVGVNHVTGDVHFLALLFDPHRTIVTIHDLVMLRRLRGIRRWVLWLFWYWLPVLRSQKVVTISESTRNQLLASVGCNPDKVSVIYNCVSEEFRPAQFRFNAACPRILQVGTGENKNLERVAEAISGLNCRLTIIGRLTDRQISVLHRYAVNFENQVGLTRAELVAKYTEADVVIFASTYEGFGLPIIEANAIGRPVITSNVASMPEVAGDAACIVDPLDPESIRNGVRRVLEDEGYRQCLIKAGYRNVERFRALKIAEQYANLYREVAAFASVGE